MSFPSIASRSVLNGRMTVSVRVIRYLNLFRFWVELALVMLILDKILDAWVFRKSYLEPTIDLPTRSPSLVWRTALIKEFFTYVKGFLSWGGLRWNWKLSSAFKSGYGILNCSVEPKLEGVSKRVLTCSFKSSGAVVSRFTTKTERFFFEMAAFSPFCVSEAAARSILKEVRLRF